jgi:nucleoside-diphosphate-sugar epimerase
MRALIIGCGYVGRAVGQDLVRNGNQVCGVTRSAGPHLELAAAGITPVQADITTPESLEALPEGWDWVVHCVASRGGDAADYRDLYLKGTRNVLKWLERSPPSKFVYTSSTSVYGQNEGEFVTESSPTEPITDTGKVLVETEQSLLAAAQKAFPAVILRLSGIYGPGRGYWFKQFLRGEALFENEPRILNMIHRDDASGAIIAALQRGKPGRVYNVSDDEPVSQIEFYQWLEQQLGRQAGPKPAPHSPSATPHGGMPANSSGNTRSPRGSTNKRISNARLKSDLGYQFKHPTFREGYTRQIESVRVGAQP